MVDKLMSAVDYLRDLKAKATKPTLEQAQKDSYSKAVGGFSKTSIAKGLGKELSARSKLVQPLQVQNTQSSQRVINNSKYKMNAGRTVNNAALKTQNDKAEYDDLPKYNLTKV